MKSVITQLEGTLLKDPNVFSYFMLIAFEASGLIRFTLLLASWPIVRLLEILGRRDEALKLTVFIATAGIPMSEIEAVARAVLPKFYMDDVDVETWRAFMSHDKRVVVSKMPRIMVEMFAKEHLSADEVVGSELSTKFGLVTGFFVGSEVTTIPDSRSLTAAKKNRDRPHPVVFHDGRLVKRPTPATALLILLWIPVGAILAALRIAVGMVLPMGATRHVAPLLGSRVVVKGNPPSPAGASGVLFVCTHRTLMDPVILSSVLRRRVPAVTYSISRFSEILSPIPTVRLTRIRDVDAREIKRQLEKGDLIVCPEGTTCREPFLLRFSALFAELTDQIVPVAMNYRVGFFHATTARGWKAMDPVFFFMNPRPVYEVTFLNQLPAEATCSSGKSPKDVANYVQRILGATLGFECTNFTRKDKYRVLAGNDGVVSPVKGWAMKKVVAGFMIS